jgi:hypothetical protein
MKRFALLAATMSLAVSACGGGGGSTPPAAPAAVSTATPVPASPPTATPQEITMSLPGATGIGTQTDPTFGAIAGYTQQTYSQILAFVPGAQIMIVNGQAATSATPHTLNVLSQTAFPASPTLGTTANGGTTISAVGFSTGSVAAGTTIGPFTLAAGLYYIGCGFHYLSNGMRTVLDVAAAATPGPQATPVPAQPVASNNPYGY